MTEASRLSTTAHALGLALEALGNALAQARHDALAASEAALGVRVEAFRAAAAAAVVTGDTLAPDQALAVSAALSRCRRLGATLSVLTGHPAPSHESTGGYTPVGRPLAIADGGSFLTARG